MNRQSGLGRGLASILPSTSLPTKSQTQTSNSKDTASTDHAYPPIYGAHISIDEQNSTKLYDEEMHKSAISALNETEVHMATIFSRLLNDLTSDTPGIGIIYSALHELVLDNDLDDAILVVQEPGLGKQVFTHDRRPLNPDDEQFLTADPGLYTTPAIEMSDEQTKLISQLCTVGLRIDLLKYDAWHDPLTGLYDRRSFDRLLEMAVARSVRYQWPFTLVLIDLDGFKELNDEQGHQAGDATLRSLGDRFRHILRFGDNAARIGGDEFALILPETEPEDVPPLLERIAIASGNEPSIGFSYGLALCPSEADGTDTLFKLADERLYEAKSKREE